MELFWWTLLFGFASILLGGALTAIVLRATPKKRAPQTRLPWSQLVAESEFPTLTPVGDRQMKATSHAIYPVALDEVSVRVKSR